MWLGRGGCGLISGPVVFVRAGGFKGWGGERGGYILIRTR